MRNRNALFVLYTSRSLREPKVHKNTSYPSTVTSQGRADTKDGYLRSVASNISHFEANIFVFLSFSPTAGSLEHLEIVYDRTTNKPNGLLHSLAIGA